MADAQLLRGILVLALGAVLGTIVLTSCGTATATNPTPTTVSLPKGGTSGTVPLALTAVTGGSATAERVQPKTPAIRTTEQPGRVFPGALPGATMPLASPGTPAPMSATPARSVTPTR
ncbi:MAG TPA: hypothetical protein VIL85_22765 [Thermomicrobiales bacterium]|jgi:hypothetical protein